MKLSTPDAQVLDLLRQANGDYVPIEDILAIWDAHGVRRPVGVGTTMSVLRRMRGVVIEPCTIRDGKPGRPKVAGYRLIEKVRRAA